jgi:hypothetical protein
MSALLWMAAALAGDAHDEALADVLRQAIEVHAEELSLPEAPPIYHLRYHLVQLGSLGVRASLGTPVYVDPRDTRALAVEVRVGSPTFDNLGFGGWENGLARTSLPLELTPHALRVGAWRLTDRAYKEAVEQHARKRSQVPDDRPDHPGDYTLTGAVTHAVDAPSVAEAEPLVALASRLSEAWTGGPALDRGDVYIGHEAGSSWTVDSEGTDVRRALSETTLRAAAHLRTPDGLLLTDQLLHTVRRPEELPSDDAMRAQIEALRDGLADAAEAPLLDDEYVGPVLFEGSAAADLFRYLLPEQLEGTPAEIPFDTWFGDLGTSRETVRVGRRVLPGGWQVVDDPLAWPEHPGAFTHDAEGTPAQPLTLVDDGIVRTLAMSRTPRSGLEQTNGHGRARMGQRAEGRVTLLQIEPGKRVSEAKLRKLALKAARSYGRDWVFVVRRLQVPAVQGLSSGGGGMVIFGGEEGPALPPPVVVVRRYADGREELVRGAAFASVHRFVLRDLVAAGPQVQTDVLFPASGGWADLGATEGLPGRISAPTVLVGEMELTPMSGDVRDAAVLPALVRE